MRVYIHIYIYIYVRTRARVRAHIEGLAEYGWKPHRALFDPKKTYHGPQFTGTSVKSRGVRFHRIRDFKQYHFDSIPSTSHLHRFEALDSDPGLDEWEDRFYTPPPPGTNF